MKLQNVGRMVFAIMALSLASLSVGCAVEGGELDESEEMTEESVSVGEAEQAYSICLEPYWTTAYSEVYAMVRNLLMRNSRMLSMRNIRSISHMKTGAWSIGSKSNISRHVRTSIVLLAMSSAAMAGCAAAETDLEAYEDQDGSEDIDETQQALTVTCNYGPTATFGFRGKIKTYFTAEDSTEYFKYDYLCGNGTTDTCGAVTITPYIPGKKWKSHNMEPAANVLYNSWGCR